MRSCSFYDHGGWALIVFTIAGVSDGVDGFLARRFKQESELGTIIDPDRRQTADDDGLYDADDPERDAAASPSAGAVLGHGRRHGRDILIIAVAGAINVMTGFRGFKPSWLGKASTFVQVVARHTHPYCGRLSRLHGFYLPTVYTTVVAFAVFSGVHYIFHVAKLMKEEPAKT